MDPDAGGVTTSEMTSEPELQPSPGEDLRAQVAAEVSQIAMELTEIDLLITQAKVEAARHEQKCTQASEKLAGLQATGTDPAQVVQVAGQMIGLTKRAALMEAQVEVLEGKRRTLARFRDSLARVAEALAGGGDPMIAARVTPERAREQAPAGKPASSRAVLRAQEELRREIARAMHDGPAQSLTNIVLQAQIVERLVARDPATAGGELRELMSMVQQTLDATKSFIFDVRPMVLDDLGMLPTLRRAARDRGRRAGVPVRFESLGTDRRLPPEVESGLFRILDEALAAYLATKPKHVDLHLDWAEQLEIRLAAGPRADARPVEAAAEKVVEETREDLPPALAAMMEERAEDQRRLVEEARTAAISALPRATWEEIQGHAAALGVSAELLAEGAELRLGVELPAPERESPG
jgi:two-component system, NarL family, sensor histidine kinase DegS